MWLIHARFWSMSVLEKFFHAYIDVNNVMDELRFSGFNSVGQTDNVKSRTGLKFFRLDIDISLSMWSSPWMGHCWFKVSKFR